MTANRINPAAATTGQDEIDQPQSLRARKVCALVYSGLKAFEYGLIVDVFGSPQLQLGSWYDFQTVEIPSEAAPVTARREPLAVEMPIKSHGAKPRIDGTGFVSVAVTQTLTALSQADLILVPGWHDVKAPVPEPILQALREAHAKGVKIASICSGVFVLAQAGLLDGKRATTHWQNLDALSSQFPSVIVDRNVSFVEDGIVLTSGGVISGVDLCLNIVRQDYGAAIANIMARRLMLPHNRFAANGSNASEPEFITRSAPRLYQGAIAPLLDKIRASINEEWGIERMASESHASARTLQRRFKDATGHSPHTWLTAERVEFAKDLLETTNLSIQQIADLTGLKTPETFRHHFKRLTGESPTRFRGKFSRKVV